MKETQIPENVQVNVEGNKIRVNGPKGSLEKEVRTRFRGGEVKMKIEDKKFVTEIEGKGRKVQAMEGTIHAHLKNMITGVTKGYKYELKVHFVHFPIRVNVKGKEIEVVNFLGEKHPRKTRIIGDAQVKVGKADIVVTGINKEDVGQTAANIARISRVKNRDYRVFHDGIYIVKRGVNDE